MSEPISCFFDKKILRYPEAEQFMYYEPFFLKHKARKEVPAWEDVPTIHGSEPNLLFKQAYVVALLCKKHIYGEEVSLSSELMTYRPFESQEITGTPMLLDLMAGTLSLAFFPTAYGDKAFVNMMFVFQPDREDQTTYEDHRKKLSGDKSVINGNHLVYILKNFVPITQTIEGNSWQLACRMAEKALLFNPWSDDRSKKNISKIMGYRSRLLNWLITGGVREEETVAVEIGSKPLLLKKYPKAIKLLIPKKNESFFDGSDVKAQIRSADDVKHAWRIITETGFELGKIPLPDHIEELHLLVGESIQHLLLVAFLLYPETIVLWHSKKTKKHAELIKAFYEDLGKGIKTELHQVDSHDMQNCYDAFNERLSKVRDRNSIIINNTGGNRLMGFAASLIARDSGIKVIYRDYDQVIDAMTGIMFHDSEYITGDISGINRWPNTNRPVNWERMLDKLPDTLDELKKQVFVQTE